MTEFVDVPGGRIAYDVTGSGPLVVLSHGIGVRRQDYRFLAPMLAQAGAGTAAMVDGAGHYPHAQSPEAVAELVIPFLKQHTGA